MTTSNNTFVDGSNNQRVDMSDAPGADTLLESLFPEDNSFTTNPSTTGPSTPSAPPQAPPSVAPEPFLKTPTGTVYQTKEDAERGTVHKDQVIEKLRREYIAKLGIDPITERQVQPQPVAQPTQPVRYREDRSRLYRDMADAVSKQDAVGWANALENFVLEYLEPAAPLVLDSAKDRAFRGLERETPDFRSFYGTDEYTKTLESVPTLKQAIEIAETNLQASQQLPDLYRLAYAVHQSRKMPELLKSATQQQPTQPRPTMAPSTLTPPPTTAPEQPKTADELLKTADGRKQLVEDLERRGINKLVW